MIDIDMKLGAHVRLIIVLVVVDISTTTSTMIYRIIYMIYNIIYIYIILYIIYYTLSSSQRVSRSSVYGKIKHSTVSVTTKSLPKRPILQKSLNLTPHLLTDSLTGVSCCQKGTYKFLRKGFPKKAAVRLDFVRINPPSPPPNLDNLFHFY